MPTTVTYKTRIPEITAELKPAVQVALEAGGEIVVESAKARVPVDTGRLQRAIHVDKQELGVMVVAGNSEAWYGMLVEHGTTYVPAHPFLVPSLEENRSEIIALVTEAIRQAT